MSSRSPSPPRRTVISGVRAEEGAATQVEELVKLRNEKLVELYCVSRMSELLDITDEESLKHDIESFLTVNDIKKGIKFQPGTLPKNKPLENGKKTASDNKKSTKEKTSTTLPSNGGGIQEISVPSNSKRPMPNFYDYGEKRAKVESERALPISSMPRNMTQPVQSMYYMDLNIQPAEPTPVQHRNKYQNRLISEVTKKSVEAGDFFHEHNINSKESVYLLTKDIIPSKVAQALPLAELKYMVQTLPLIKLIPMAHKALTTDIMNNALNEGRITVVSSRIEELRRLGLWSLRQPKHFVDAWEHEPSHHRTLMAEAKWMQADFKEGYSYKIAVCTTLAQAVADYWNYGDVCCQKRAPIKHTPADYEQPRNDEKQKDAQSSLNQSPSSEDLPTHDVVSSTIIKTATGCPDLVQDSEGSKQKNVMKVAHEGNCSEQFLLPEATFSKEANLSTEADVSLQDEKKADEKQLRIIAVDPFKLTLSFQDLKPVERAILKDAPLYTGLQSCNNNDTSLPFVPTSKSLVTLEDDHFLKLVERQLIDEEQSLVQLSKRRGMFYGNRRSHYLKPPPAPSLRYLQNRTPTIWLPEDDQELVKNINAYAYNWELISANMNCRPSMSYVSNIERRTPWQCFERFVQLNEKFSFNDLKGPRAHTVQQWLMEAHKFQQRQNRRISPLGVGPESIQRGHKRLRWASMFEAMRKCIKKRENAPRPNPTQPRKPLDCKNMKVPTPAEMSQLKAQRDEALRKDLQMRRSFKNRMQQQQQHQHQQVAGEATPNANGMKARSRMSTTSNDGSTHSDNTPQATKTASNKHTPTSAASLQRRFTEREIIESYSRKILAQKPELSLETATKAAQSYYRSVCAKQQEQQRQQEQKTSPLQQAVSHQSEHKSAKSSGGLSGNNIDNHSDPAGKIKSPTPQEILQKFQK